MNILLLRKLIQASLIEDIGDGDITTESIVAEDQYSIAKLLVKQSGIIAGLKVFTEVFRQIDANNISFDFYKNDGDYCNAGEQIAQVKGPTAVLLKGERVALNFLQHLSGIATLTNEYVKIAQKYGVQIVDTRKTLPGLRTLEKYAVHLGGGVNHRHGLYDAVLIKDNHIKAAGGITNAVAAVRKNISFTSKIEVETFSLADVKEALSCKVDIIMLDNFEKNDIKQAIDLINKRALVELSGNISLDTLEEYCKFKPDIISVGRLTHSASALDLSLKIE